MLVRDSYVGVFSLLVQVGIILIDIESKLLNRQLAVCPDASCASKYSGNNIMLFIKRPICSTKHSLLLCTIMKRPFLYVLSLNKRLFQYV